MRKYYILIIILLFFVMVSCKKTQIPTITEETKTHEFLVDYDYGMVEYGKPTLLYDGCFMVNDLTKYGVKDLLAGDIVKVTYTGIIKMALSHPGQIIFEEEQIIDVEVLKAKTVELYVRQVPGGGYNILTEDDKYYQLPDYFIYDNTFTSINNIYQNLKFTGTIPYNTSDDKVIGLYAEDYDSTKVKLGTNNNY